MFCSYPPKPFILRQMAKQTRCLIGFGNRRVSAQGRWFYHFVCHCGGAWGSWSVDLGPCFKPWRLFTLVHECHFAVNAMYRLKVWKSFKFPVQTPQPSARNDCEGAVRSKFNSYILGNALTDWARGAINVKSNRSPQVWRTVENH